MLGNCLMDLRKHLRNEERKHYYESTSSKHRLLLDEQLSDTKQKMIHSTSSDNQVRRSALGEGSMNSLRETTTNFDFQKQEAGLRPFDEVKTSTTTTTSAPGSHASYTSVLSDNATPSSRSKPGSDFMDMLLGKRRHTTPVQDLSSIINEMKELFYAHFFCVFCYKKKKDTPKQRFIRFNLIEFKDEPN